MGSGFLIRRGAGGSTGRTFFTSFTAALALTPPSCLPDSVRSRYCTAIEQNFILSLVDSINGLFSFPIRGGKSFPVYSRFKPPTNLPLRSYFSRTHPSPSSRFCWNISTAARQPFFTEATPCLEREISRRSLASIGVFRAKTILGMVLERHLLRVRRGFVEATEPFSTSASVYQFAQLLYLFRHFLIVLLLIRPPVVRTRIVSPSYSTCMPVR